MNPEIDPTTTAQKPGWKTTEFWLTLIAQMLGALLASGVLAEGSEVAKIAGLVLSALTALGYQANRAMVKASGNKAAAVASIVETGANPSRTP